MKLITNACMRILRSSLTKQRNYGVILEEELLTICSHSSIDQHPTRRLVGFQLSDVIIADLERPLEKVQYHFEGTSNFSLLTVCKIAFLFGIRGIEQPLKSQMRPHQSIYFPEGLGEDGFIPIDKQRKHFLT